MQRFLRRPSSAVLLVGAVAVGALGAGFQSRASTALRPEDVASLRTIQPAQVQRAQDRLLGQRSELGLGQLGGLTVRNAFTNSQGQAVVHLTQTFAGHRVWGGEATAHVLPGGDIRTDTHAIRPAIALQGEPTVTAEAATAIALASFASKGPLAVPAKAERVVFPSASTGGVAARWDVAKRQPVIDRQLTVLAHPPTAPYVWAWEVKAVTSNPKDGLRAVSYVVDGTTGTILHKSNDLRGVDVLPPTTAVPAVGTGVGLYSGPVALPLSVDPAGLYWFWDQTRGSNPNPYLAGQALNNGYTGPTTGLMVLYEDHPSLDNVCFQNATNGLGDGKPYLGTPNEATPNGQTTGVDAFFSLSRSWDFFQGILGLQGVDGTGASPLVQTHIMTTDVNGNPIPYDGAYSWAGGLAIYLGDGTYPGDPQGTLAYAEVDVVAHELFHNLIDVTAGLYGTPYSSESPALAEAISDAMGEAAEAYAYGTPVVDQYGAQLIPASGNDWGVQKRVHRGTALRSFQKPSTDGVSQDSWFEGLGMLDPHYANGPLNRAFYFLSQGASSKQGDDSYSPYLPGGMAGVGLDHATRLWFKMVTQYLGPDSEYPEARTAAISAARDLYGIDSQEELAVMNAFAAVNVGEAAGQSPGTHVGFPVRHTAGFLYDNYPYFRRAPVVGRGTVVTLHAEVTNNADKRITWKPGVPFVGTKYDSGGYVDEMGRWHTPMRMDWHGVTATSVADPLQYATTGVFLLNMDTDDDGESDAVDLGGIALSWGLGWTISAANSVFYEPFVIDDDIAFFHEMMNNAYAVPQPDPAAP